MDTELPNTKNIKISIDGSAELLTPNPLPRNFNHKIIIKIQASNGKNSKKGPWTNWKNMQYLDLKTLHF